MKQTELREFIKQTMLDVIQGARDAGIKATGEVEFEIALSYETTAGAGVKIYVADLGGQCGTTESSRIKFAVSVHTIEDENLALSQLKDRPSGYNIGE